MLDHIAFSVDSFMYFFLSFKMTLVAFLSILQETSKTSDYWDSDNLSKMALPVIKGRSLRGFYFPIKMNRCYMLSTEIILFCFVLKERKQSEN